MNLRDRTNSEGKRPEPSRTPEISTDTMPMSKLPSREQTLLSEAQNKITELTAQLSSQNLKLEQEMAQTKEAKERLSTISSENSMLQSKTLEMKSTIANLKEELSSVRDLSQKALSENRELKDSRQEVSSMNSILQSRAVKLQSTITGLRAELSSAQALSQNTLSENSLLKNNNKEILSQNTILQARVREMESALADLQNRLSSEQDQIRKVGSQTAVQKYPGNPMFLPNQENLLKEIADLKERNDELKKLVDMSNVTAVKEAREEAKKALDDTYFFIGVFDSMLDEHKKEADKNIHEAEKQIQLIKEKAYKDKGKYITVLEKERVHSVYLSLLILICGIIQSPVFFDHLRIFLCSPIVWLRNRYAAYKLWLSAPCYHSVLRHMETRPFSPFWIWPMRILSVMVVIFLLFITLSLLYLLCRYYAYKWCFLSYNVALCSLALLTGLGPWIAKYLHINIVLLFFVIQVTYLLVRQSLVFDFCFLFHEILARPHKLP